jgi:LuxR family transcriptional regulator, maltose regulon positive regulatory protein
MSDLKIAYPLILNKVSSPHYITPTLRRDRLLEWLQRSASCRAIVLAADAGYGKTTLLWQWEREVEFPCYWYKLDRNDRDWTLHISYMIEAVRRRHSGFGTQAHSVLQQLAGQGSSRAGVAAYLLAEMHDRLDEPCTFILDDWQYVNAATEVRGLWNQILRDAPPTCRFVFASRAKPRLQFARFKTHGGYAELGTDALRFTEGEIEELFRDIYQDPLDKEELTELEQRTEGWAASLQLIGVSLQEKATPDARKAFIAAATGATASDLFEYLAEEVLDQQPEETRNLLLSTSIVQQVTPNLAERLAGVLDGRQALIDLEQRGLFTYRLDDSRYRYHHLFREFLQRRLTLDRSEAEKVGLHIHAASYFETAAEWPDAIEQYLLAGLQRQAARLVALHGEELAGEGRLGLVDAWLLALPGRSIRDNARLSLLRGELALFRSEWAESEAALERARSYFARKGDKRMEALACLKLSSLESYLGNVQQAAAHAERGLRLVPLNDPVTTLRLEGNLAVTRLWASGRLQDVASACRRIAVEAMSLGHHHTAAIAFNNLGIVLRYIGAFAESEASLERAAAIWAGRQPSPFADNHELVITLLMRDRVARAEEVSGAAIDRTKPWSRAQAASVLACRKSLIAARSRPMLLLDTLLPALLELIQVPEDPVPEVPPEEPLWWPRGTAILLWAILIALLVAIVAWFLRPSRRAGRGKTADERD